MLTNAKRTVCRKNFRWRNQSNNADASGNANETETVVDVHAQRGGICSASVPVRWHALYLQVTWEEVQEVTVATEIAIRIRTRQWSCQHGTVHEIIPPGQPLDTETRAFVEPRFGHDFSHLPVHSDARATESGAEHERARQHRSSQWSGGRG